MPGFPAREIGEKKADGESADEPCSTASKQSSFYCDEKNCCYWFGLTLILMHSRMAHHISHLHRVDIKRTTRKRKKIPVKMEVM